MSEPKHTPGPWEIKRGGNYYEWIWGNSPAGYGNRVVDDKGAPVDERFCLAEIKVYARDQNHAERNANRALIEAAPDLAAALEDLLPWALGQHTPCDCERCDVVRQAGAALRKAGLR
jgi:hypothetical protein